MSDYTPLALAAKALSINLNEQQYGSIVEIGAGQEVARNFFRVGAAAGTIAKTSSAYDMAVSDAIYGKSGRYVSRERVEKILNYEFQLCVARLEETRPDDSTFFAYAASVEAKAYKRENECHGWIGIQFQGEAKQNPPNQVVCHVRMLNKTNEQQSEALGILGVNLIYASFHYRHDVNAFIKSLKDNLGDDRIEIDLIHFSGEHFKNVDNRLASLLLVENWLTRVVMFDTQGNPAVPRDVLYKKPTVVTRGSFKPPTKVHLDMTECGVRLLAEATQSDEEKVVRLAEISMSQLVSEQKGDNKDFLARVTLANSLGMHVLLSDYVRYFSLSSWLRRHTNQSIAILIKSIDLPYIFNHDLYKGLEGGTLEGLGKLFHSGTKVLVYPAFEEGRLMNLSNAPKPDSLKHIVAQLIEDNKLIPIERFSNDVVGISARETMKMILAGESGWEENLLPETIEIMKQNNLHGINSIADD
jgi:hypothetical protein